MKAPKPAAAISLTEQAEALRTRAAELRLEEAEQQRAVDGLRAKDEAGTLEARAEALELEQRRLDRAAQLRAQADAAEVSSDELDRQAARLNGEMLEAAIRAARFERQIADDVTERRQELERKSTEAAKVHDAEAVMAAERDLSLLPTLETRLQAEADAADAQASELNEQASEVESRAAASRANAAALRRWADTDPLAPAAPPLPDSQQVTRAHTLLESGARRAAREVALRAVRALPDPGDQEEAAAVFERAIEAHRVARARALHAEDLARLEEVERLVEQVRDEALLEADRRLHAPADMMFAGPIEAIAGVARQELAASVTSYRESMGRALPRCHDLAVGGPFGAVDGPRAPYDRGRRFATAVSAAAAVAVDELVAERAALETAARLP